MKLIVQIPCFNEAATLPETLAAIPRHIPGITAVEILVINDGSTDETIQTAQAHGVHHIVDLKSNRGLAQAFKTGLQQAVALGADIIVNTDGDNQYNGEDIPHLIQPILMGQADIVVGERPILDHPEFSWTKKVLQKLGSSVVRAISQTTVPDTTSGFRAFSADAAMRINLFSGFSYTLETIIQAGNSNLRVTSVPIGINPKTRDSRLFRSIPQYLLRSGTTIAQIAAVYRSGPFFSLLGVPPIFFAFVLALRYTRLVFFQRRHMTAFWPSIVLAGFLLVIGFQLFLTGILAEMVGSNRKLLEELLYRERCRNLPRKTSQAD
jgi:glycosyltransferase involved in cell wall biosynthesis